MNPNQLDQQALNLAKAIRRAETGTSTDPYNAKGASGESGAYQYMPDTWKQWSKQYLGKEDAPLSVENQNKVAYSRIKELKDQGLNPAQIASMWNSGGADKYKQNWRGKNSQGVEYDTPAYVQKVSQYYNETKMGGQAPTPTPGRVNPMEGIQTTENRPAPQPEPVAPEQLPKAPEEEKEGVDLGTRIGKGVLDFVAPILTEKDRTAGQWVGDAALTAMNVIPATAVLKYGLGAAKLGVKALRGAEALSKTEKAADIASGVVKRTLSPKNIAIGGATGYGMDVASSLSGGETDVGDVLTPGVGTILGLGGGALARRVPRAEVDKAARDLIPDLTRGKAVSSTGRTGLEKSGIFGNISQPVGTQTYKVTEATLRNVPNFNRLGTYTEKLNAVNSANQRLAEKLAKDVVQNGDDILYPYRELASKMKAIEPPIQIRADNTQLRQYQIAQQSALKLAQDNGGKISGLFKARKEFDALVEKEFPTLYDRENAPMRQAITDIRKVMNETIEQSLKGRGVDYSGSLKEQMYLYDAREALASKAYGELGTNSLQRFGQQYPGVKGALNTLGLGGAGAATYDWLTKD